MDALRCLILRKIQIEQSTELISVELINLGVWYELYDMSQIRKYMNTVYIHFDIISLNRIDNMTGTTRNLLTPFFSKKLAWTKYNS